MSRDLITTTVPASVADALITRAGIAEDARGRYLVPVEAEAFMGTRGPIWQREVALMVALVILATNEEL